MAFPERIETVRLLLRKPVFPDDAALIHIAYASDPAVTRYDTWRPHYDVADTLRSVWTRLEWWKEGREYSWVIAARGTGEVLGMISATGDGTHWRARLGYTLARAQWGRGIMSEAACAVAEMLLALPEIRRVWAVVDVENPASARVLEKAGLEREGLLRRWSVHPALGSEPRDCWCYARVR